MDEQVEELRRKVGEAAQEFGKGSAEYNRAVAQLNRGLRRAYDSMTSYANTVTGLAGSLARGNTNFTQLNGMISSLTNTIAAATIAFPAAAVAVKLLGEGMQVALEQFDSALGIFYDLSRVGAAGVDGIDSLRKQFVAAGVPMQQFQQMIVNNSTALAGFYGSTTEGAESFSKSLGSMKKGTDGLDMSLRSLGFNSVDVATTLADYANIQRRIGGEAVRDQALLTSGSIEYGKQLDLLAKVTGKSREQQQALLDQALSEGRYRANRMRMERAGQADQARELDNFMLIVSNISPTLGQGIRDVSSGFISTQAAQQAFLSTGGQLPTIIEGLKNGQLSYSEAVGKIQDATKSQIPTMEALSLGVGDSTGTFVPFAEGMDLVTYGLGDLEGALKRAKNVQDTQIDSLELAGSTKNLIEMNKNLEFASSKMQATAISFDTIAGLTSEIVKGMEKISDLTYSSVGQFGDLDINQRLAKIQTEITDVKSMINELSDPGGNIEGMGGSEQLDSLYKRLDQLEKLYLKNQEIANKNTSAVLTFGNAVVRTNQKTREQNSLSWLPDFMNPTVSTEYGITQNLQERGIDLAAPMSPQSITDYNKLVEQFNGDTTSKFFLDGLEKIFKNQVTTSKVQSTQPVTDFEKLFNNLNEQQINNNKKLDQIIKNLDIGNTNTKNILQRTVN